MDYLNKKEKAAIGTLIGISLPAFILLEAALWTGRLTAMIP